MALGTNGACIRCEREVTLLDGHVCGICDTESLLTGDEDHDNAQLKADRLNAEEQDRFTIKPVWLTINERAILRTAIEEYLDKAGQIRGMPEAETWLRAVWHLLVDIDQSLDEVEPPDPVDHQAWRREQTERTGVDPLTGRESSVEDLP